MWVTKLLISQVKKRIFCPKTTKFGPKLAFLVNLGQAMQAYSMPCCGSVGGCGARAVSRKTPIYFMNIKFNKCESNRKSPAGQTVRRNTWGSVHRLLTTLWGGNKWECQALCLPLDLPLLPYLHHLLGLARCRSWAVHRIL